MASLNLTTDLTSVIASPQKRDLLKQMQEGLKASLKQSEGLIVSTKNPFELASFQKEAWEPFEKKIISDFSEMGVYWQILFLNDIQNQLKNRGVE